MKQFEPSIDHPVLIGAKKGFDACLKRAIQRAINTGSDEGSVTLKVSFEINEAADEKTGEIQKVPLIKFKAQYSVPVKAGCEGTVGDRCVIVPDPEEGWMLINGQITMDEVMEEAKG